MKLWIISLGAGLAAVRGGGGLCFVMCWEWGLESRYIGKKA
jgi:hypothetical protein